MGNSLPDWLRTQLIQRNLTGRAVAAGAGVGMATISDILHKDHVPRIDTLMRLADYFGAPRQLVLRIAAGLPSEAPAAGAEDPDALIDELLHAFRQIPDEWKQQALADVELYARLASPETVRIIGEEKEPASPAEDQEDEQTTLETDQ